MVTAAKRRQTSSIGNMARMILDTQESTWRGAPPGHSRPATGTPWRNLGAHRLPQLIPDEVLHDPRWGAPITPVDAVDREDPQAGGTLGQDGARKIHHRE